MFVASPVVAVPLLDLSCEPSVVFVVAAAREGGVPSTCRTIAAEVRSSLARQSVLQDFGCAHCRVRSNRGRERCSTLLFVPPPISACSVDSSLEHSNQMISGKVRHLDWIPIGSLPVLRGSCVQ